MNNEILIAVVYREELHVMGVGTARVLEGKPLTPVAKESLPNTSAISASLVADLGLPQTFNPRDCEWSSVTFSKDDGGTQDFLVARTGRNGYTA